MKVHNESGPKEEPLITEEAHHHADSHDQHGDGLEDNLNVDEEELINLLILKACRRRSENLSPRRTLEALYTLLPKETKNAIEIS